MKKTVCAFVVATALSIPVAMPVAAQTADGDMVSMGQSMLLAGLYNALGRMGISTEGVENLTLSEAVQLAEVLNESDDTEGEIRRRAETILEAASGR